MNDIALSFDPTGFLSGIKAIENQLVSLNSNFKKTGDVGTKKNQKVQLSAMNLMGVFAKLGMVVGGFKMALSGIPEIGRTFKIAGDIFQRNFLWPLRKELIPILQSLLNWVRENRAMFVRWGTVVANIFRTIFSIVKSLVKMVKGVFNTLFSELEKIFGKATSSVTEMANVILFKITSIAMFIMMSLEPVFSWIAKQFAKVIGFVKKFIDGFMIGFGDNIIPIFKQFSDMFGRVVNMFDRLLPKQSKLNSLFTSFGAILGTTVLVALLSIITALDTVITGIEKAINRISYFNAWRDKNKSEMNRLNRENEQINENFKRRLKDREEMLKGSFSRTKDVLFGKAPEAKGQITSNNSTATSIVNDHKVVTINVNGAKDPISISREIKTTLESQLRESRFRAGGR